jgi:CDP-Glycerol:Poly(glycerophosphate) glycerophosphotransferase.
LLRNIMNTANSVKPHPLLRVKLYGHVDWGQKRTDEYYARWKEMENTQLETDSYIDLFNASDALILDSGSFTIEYLYCGKPSLFMMFNTGIRDKFNEFGKMALDQHYHAYNQDDIINFIEKVVLEGKDTMKAQRDHFYETYLFPPNGKSASQNIFDHICQEIFD